MIYVTHDQVEAMTLGQRIAVFDRGRIVQVGPPLELYRQPASEFVAGFLGTPRLNLIDRPGPAAAAAHRQLWDELGGAGHAHAQRLGVRPEHLRLAEPGSGVPCTLQAAEQLGESAILHLEVQGLADPLRLRAPSSAGESPVGCAMAMAAQRQQVLAFDAEGRRLDPCSARPEEGTP
jgi:multiple sugar transport system ATP-binding protein